MNKALPRLTILAGAVAASVAATPAMAYSTCPEMTLTGPSAATPGQATTVTAHVVGGSGDGVTFSQASGPSGCAASFSNATPTADASGSASTAVTFAGSCQGQVVVSAMTAGSCVASLTMLVATGAVYPNTAAAAPAGHPSPLPAPRLPALLAMAVLAMAGVVALLRPTGAHRRTGHRG